MNYIFFLIITFLSSLIFPKNLFMGLNEDNTVNKNNFLCPVSLNATGNIVCNNMDAAMVGFDISGGHTIQIFNNQQYWLQQKFEQEHLLRVRGYVGDRLSSAMAQEGWDHMGAFSIIFTTDPVILSCIKPEMIPAKGQIKLIVQLWYSGSNGLQLWAQDVEFLNKDQNFRVLVSNSFSDFSNDSVVGSSQPTSSLTTSAATSLPSLSNSLSSATDLSATFNNSSAAKTPRTLESFKQQFLEEVGFSPKNIDKNVYSTAYGSPRSIKIQVQ